MHYPAKLTPITHHLQQFLRVLHGSLTVGTPSFWYRLRICVLMVVAATSVRPQFVHCCNRSKSAPGPAFTLGQWAGADQFWHFRMI